MINFENRLKSLKDRRQGTRERALLENNAQAYDLKDYRSVEAYEGLTESDAVKYAIGAMAAVNHDSTRISIEEGERVADTLISMLATEGVSVTKEMQGSVALDIHIEGYSDVDMLMLKEDIVLVQTPKVDGTPVSCSDPRSMEDMVKEIRVLSEDKLTSRYHAAHVDCSNNKSIALSGGSLKRKVDVVPACWHHTHDYQRTGQKHDKAVRIYHKGKHTLEGNQPFLHMKRVNDKDSHYSGNLKKVARLLKNIVADMPAAKKRVAKQLSSYDIVAIAYNMNDYLDCPEYMSLTLVEKTRAYLSLLKGTEDYRNSIETPDGGRKVFNEVGKVDALEIITKEVEDLAISIYKALEPQGQQTYDSNALITKSVFL